MIIDVVFKLYNILFQYVAIKIKKILVALDGSKNSFKCLDVAINLARQCHASITCLYVLEIEKPQTNQQISSLEKKLLLFAQKVMEKAKIETTKHDILFFDTISYGHSGTRIVDIAQRKNFDMVVIGSRGMGSVKELFFGSTSNYVLHKSKKPVLIVR